MKNLLPTERLRFLAKLTQKKHRLAENLVVVEGLRVLRQLISWGIKPLELYSTEETTDLGIEPAYLLGKTAMQRICDSEAPPSVAGLFSLPAQRKVIFSKAFYLEGISDPGNMGTIFRSAAAFGIDCLILSPQCCEISSPKVIRASLGAVFKVPYFVCPVADLPHLKADIFTLDMNGSVKLAKFTPPAKPYILGLGSEAHGLSEELKGFANGVISIPMRGEMESLNAAITFAIAAYAITHSSTAKH